MCLLTLMNIVDKDVMIYGAGDVAAEAALALCDKNRTTITCVDESFTFPRKRNIDAMEGKDWPMAKLKVNFASKVKGD